MNHPLHLQIVASVSSTSRPVVLAAKDPARPVQRVRSSKGIAAEQTSPSKGRTADLRAQKQAANENDQQISVDRYCKHSNFIFTSLLLVPEVG